MIFLYSFVRVYTRAAGQTFAMVGDNQDILGLINPTVQTVGPPIAQSEATVQGRL